MQSPIEAYGAILPIAMIPAARSADAADTRYQAELGATLLTGTHRPVLMKLRAS